MVDNLMPKSSISKYDRVGGITVQRTLFILSLSSSSMLYMYSNNVAMILEVKTR